MITVEMPSPISDEVENGKFKYPTQVNSFRGQPLPSDFEITVGDEQLREGQVVGYSRLGKVLRWVCGSVVSVG